MANSYGTYTDKQILKCLLTKDFSDIGGVFEDNVLTKLKPGAFYGAKNLTGVSLPNVTYIGENAFTEVSISSLNISWDKLTYIGAGAFEGMQDQTLYPETLNLAKATTIGPGAFCASSSKRNRSVKTLNLPLWDGSVSTDKLYTTSATRGVFAYFGSLENLNAPEVTRLPANCFQYCSALSVVSLPKLAAYTSTPFQSCSGLVKIKIGGDIKSLSTTIVTGASKIEALVLSGVTSVPTMTANSWSSTQFANGSAYFYVPSSLVSAFKVTSGWSTYADKIRAIEDYPDICNF